MEGVPAHPGDIQADRYGAGEGWSDFAHFTNPFGLQAIVYNAHCEACADIESWKDDQADAEQEESARKRLHTLLLAETPRRGGDENCSPEIEVSDIGDGVSPVQSAAPAASPALPKPVALPGGGLLRGVAFDPDAPGRNARWEPAIPQLEVAPAPERLPAVDDQTEALLNAIIGECHFYMREVTFPSLCHAGNADDRMGWIGKAVQLAETGARVGKAVARLRHGPGMKETRHTTTIVQNRLDAG